MSVMNPKLALVGMLPLAGLMKWFLDEFEVKKYSDFLRWPEVSLAWETSSMLRMLGDEFFFSSVGSFESSRELDDDRLTLTWLRKMLLLFCLGGNSFLD